MRSHQHSLLAILSLLITAPALATEPAVRARPGFAVELIYSVPRENGSWISLAIDDRGALYACAQNGPLYRLDSTGHCRSLDLPVGGVHGLTWLSQDLYAVVGERTVCQTGLYRLRDTNADGKLDEAQLLKALDGYGEHGPHAVLAAPDQKSLLILAGNATPLPDLTKSRLAIKPTSDSLLPPLPAHMGSETRGQSHGGWICNTDLAGKNWELLCCGLRNAYSLATNADGELFTADSDTEFEYGLPWYRPNRLLHCTSGADFGWRSGAQKPPEGALDLTPAVASLGAGSPSAIVSGGPAFQYPVRHQKALFIGDWSHGRLLAAHLTPQGATYTATIEEIVTGTPLPIAAACVSPKDGTLYFITGGRDTASHVYRLVWRGE